MTTPLCALPPIDSEPRSGRGGRGVSLGVVTVAVMLGLAGCGGGGSSDSIPAPSPAPNPIPSPSPSPSPPPPPPALPVAVDSCDAFPSATGSVQSGTLAGKATSPDNRALSFSLVSQAQSGTAQLSASGAFTYTRTSPARGDVDSFVYKVTDTVGLSAQGTAQVIYGTRRIMPLGDSITDGIVFSDISDQDYPAVANRVGYRKVLRDRLASSGYAVDFVGSLNSGRAAGLEDDDHEGHPGANQADIRTGIVAWLTQSPADVVLLHIGTNDVPGDTTASATAAATSSILGNVNTWAGTKSNPRVQLLLAQIIGQRSNTPEVAQFNISLTSLYKSNWADPSGSRPRFVVDLVDMNSRLNTTSDLSGAEDVVGLHPNMTGYGEMANAWFDFLVQNQAIFKCP